MGWKNIGGVENKIVWIEEEVEKETGRLLLGKTSRLLLFKLVF